MFMQAGALDAVRAEDVPLAQPFMNGRELELVGEVLRSGQLSDGPMRRRFEHAFAEFVGVRHAVAVSGAAAALRVAALCAGWRPGDEVITSPLASTAALDAIRRTGAAVSYADIDPRTQVLDPAAVEAAITPHTRGILAVDAAGWPADMATFDTIARVHGLTLVQDSCQAVRPASTPTWTVAYAFDQERQLAIGDGGMLCTDDDELARAWRTRLAHVRMSDVASAIGIAQLEKLPRMLAMREHVAAEYRRALGDVDALTLPAFEDAGTVRSWTTFVVELADGIDRDIVLQRLAEHGIEARSRRMHRTRPGACRAAKHHARTAIDLPLYPHLSPQQQDRVVQALVDAIAGT